MDLWPPWLSLLLINLLTLCQDAEAQSSFTIDQVNLTILPHSTVQRGTNVSLRCEAEVSQSSSQLIHSFSFLKYNTMIYSKNSSEPVVEYSLTPARAFNSGTYKCRVHIHTKDKSSEHQKLTVIGVQTPKLTVQSHTVYEGEEIRATCSAPDESGSLYFFFYNNNQEHSSIPSSSSSADTTIDAKKLGENLLHCKYKHVALDAGNFSNISNTVKVTVREISIHLSMSIKPDGDVVEGDEVFIECNVAGFISSSGDLEIFLTKKPKTLWSANNTFRYRFQSKLEDSGEYVCKAEKGKVQKRVTSRLNVTELFSTPVLSMTPEEVFKGQQLSLSCRSAIHFEKRINHTDVKYTLYKNQQLIKMYKFEANQASNGNYTCVAKANGINKTSKVLTINVKTPVSTPVIHTVGKVIVNQSFQIKCESELGTLPISYALLKYKRLIRTMKVTGPLRSALFNISSITHKEEIHSFTCQAENQGINYTKLSQALSAIVIEPVSKPVLNVNYKGSSSSSSSSYHYTVPEGTEVALNCSVQVGTMPVTFKWYHSGITNPLVIKPNSSRKSAHVFTSIERDQKGTYYCEASNDANETKKSEHVTIAVHLAGWKKAVIAVICIVILVLIVTILILFLKNVLIPQKKKRLWSCLCRKPARPKSSDPMRMSLTDFEENAAVNTSPGLMGKNVWCDRESVSDSDVSKDDEENEEQQYTKMHPQQTMDTEEVAPMITDKEPVNGEIQDCTHDAVNEGDPECLPEAPKDSTSD